MGRDEGIEEQGLEYQAEGGGEFKVGEQNERETW